MKLLFRWGSTGGAFCLIKLGRDDSAAFAEADSGVSFAFAVPPENHFVAILKKLSRLARRQRDRLRAAPGQFQKTAARVWRFTGNGSACQQIAGLQIAAVAGMVRNQLGRSPVQVTEPAAANSGFGRSLFPHPGRSKVHLKRDIEGPAPAVFRRIEIGKRRRIALRARERGGAERFQGFGCDNPWRNRGCETLPQKRAERLIFPCLYIARRPVVHEAETEDMRSRFVNGNGLPQCVSLSYVHAYFQFKVERSGGSENGRVGVGHFDLPLRAMDAGTADYKR